MGRKERGITGREERKRQGRGWERKKLAVHGIQNLQIQPDLDPGQILHLRIRPGSGWDRSRSTKSAGYLAESRCGSGTPEKKITFSLSAINY